MDEIDLLILKKLMTDGRASWKALAAETRVSQPTAAARVRGLISQKILLGFRAIVDPEALGCHLTAYVFVTLTDPDARDPFLKKIYRMPTVIECHHTAGEYDYLLKIRCRNTKALDHIISAEIKSVKTVARTQTMIVMETMKETTALPIAAAD